MTSQSATLNHVRLVLFARLKKLLWLLLAVVLLALVLKDIGGFTQSMAQGLAAGAGLGFLVQGVFAYLSYRRLSYGGQVIFDMTLALLSKWALAFIGFAMIFALPVTLSIPAVFAGFAGIYVAALWLFALPIKDKGSC